MRILTEGKHKVTLNQPTTVKAYDIAVYRSDVLCKRIAVPEGDLPVAFILPSGVYIIDVLRGQATLHGELFPEDFKFDVSIKSLSSTQLEPDIRIVKDIVNLRDFSPLKPVECTRDVYVAATSIAVAGKYVKILITPLISSYYEYVSISLGGVEAIRVYDTMSLAFSGLEIIVAQCGLVSVSVSCYNEASPTPLPFNNAVVYYKS